MSRAVRGLTNTPGKCDFFFLFSRIDFFKSAGPLNEVISKAVRGSTAKTGKCNFFFFARF